MTHGEEGMGQGRCDVFASAGFMPYFGSRPEELNIPGSIPGEGRRESNAWDSGQFARFERKETIMQRKASAVWQGDLKSGKGAISTDSGTLKNTQYSFSTRFENGVGTNPEELLAAAHAG